jgi:hypothetical protein
VPLGTEFLKTTSKNNWQKEDLVMLTRNTVKLLAGSLFLLAVLLTRVPEARSACSSTISAACTITTAGYYTLSTNVTGAANGDAIDVAANDVTINLAGYSVEGGSGSGEAINACTANPCVVNTKVYNGHIKSSGAYGADLGTPSVIEQVQGAANGSVPIYPDNDSIVFQTIAYGTTGSTGIEGFADSVLTQNVSGDNGGSGIESGSGGVVMDNASSSNTSGYALDLGTNTGYGRNVGGGNSSGCVTGGTTMGDNVCSGTKQ